jgi:hypothetical protein
MTGMVVFDAGFVDYGDGRRPVQHVKVELLAERRFLVSIKGDVGTSSAQTGVYRQ